MARKRFGGGVLWRSDLLSRRAIYIIGHICDLPSSAEGPIKIDEIRRDLRVAIGKIIFALQQLGLCRGDIEEVDRPLRVMLPGDQAESILPSTVRLGTSTVFSGVRLGAAVISGLW